MTSNKVGNIGLGTRLQLLYGKEWIEVMVVTITPTTIFVRCEGGDEILDIDRKKEWIDLLFHNKLKVLQYKDLTQEEPHNIGLGTRMHLFYEKEWVEVIIVNITSTIISTILFRNEYDYKIIDINRNTEWIDLFLWNKLKLIQYKDLSEQIFIVPLNEEVTIFYNGKWRNAKIIDCDENVVTLKLWKSIFKIKTVEIQRADHWKYLICQKLITFRERFPNWVKVGQYVLYQQKAVFHRAKILKYRHNKSITVYYLEYDRLNKPKQICIKTLKSIKAVDEDYVHTNTSDGTLIRERYHIFDDLDNKILLQQLSSKQDDQKIPEKMHKKSTQKQIVPNQMKMDDENVEFGDISCEQRYIYQVIMECDAFPLSINQTIVSFLKEDALYICPPCKSSTGSFSCGGTTKHPAEWNQYAYSNMNYMNKVGAVIGMEFVMNTDLYIKGVKLFDVEITNPLKNKLHLIRYMKPNGGDRWNKSNEITVSMQPGAGNQFIFNYPIQLKSQNLVNQTFLYRLVIEMQTNTKLHHLHDLEVGNRIIPIMQNYKCFEQIKWAQFNDSFKDIASIKVGRKKTGITAPHIFPHIAFIL